MWVHSSITTVAAVKSATHLHVVMTNRAYFRFCDLSCILRDVNVAENINNLAKKNLAMVLQERTFKFRQRRWWIPLLNFCMTFKIIVPWPLFTSLDPLHSTTLLAVSQESNLRIVDITVDDPVFISASESKKLFMLFQPRKKLSTRFQNFHRLSSPSLPFFYLNERNKIRFWLHAWILVGIFSLYIPRDRLSYPLYFILVLWYCTCRSYSKFCSGLFPKKKKL